jgi:hypothetical protein
MTTSDLKHTQMRSYLVPLCIMAAFILLFSARFLLMGNILMLRDLMFDYYPWHFFIQEVLHDGYLPL